MEGLNILSDLLLPGDLMCKLDLKSAHFHVPLQSASRTSVQFLWSGNIYEFFCLRFRLGLVSLIFTKVIKINIFLPSVIIIYERAMIYLDDMLLLGEQGRKFWRHWIHWLSDWRTLSLSQTRRSQKDRRFLRLVVNSVSVTLAIPTDKIEKLQKQCEEWINNPQTVVIKLTQLLRSYPFLLRHFYQDTCTRYI